MEFEEVKKLLLKLTPQIWKKILNKQFQRGLILKYDDLFESNLFEIVKCIRTVAYKLKLSERLKLQPTFHWYICFLSRGKFLNPPFSI